MRKDRIEGKRISILGMARSGVSSAILLHKLGAEVFVSDVKKKELLTPQIEQLEEFDIEYETAGHTSKALHNKDFLVVSPGIPSDIPILSQAESLGIPRFSEIEVAYWLTDSKIVGITGSNGKTTTVTLLGEILKEDKREYQLGGNIGIPFSGIVEKVSPAGIIVLELSSFQLEWIEEFRPYVASVLNITPDHLDRHPDMKAYVQAKLRILENQTEDDYAVLNVDDEGSLKFAAFGKSKKVFFSTKTEPEPGAFIRSGRLITRFNGKESEIMEVKEINLRGPHNLSNACAACAISGILGAFGDAMRGALKSFPGVEHRLEQVATISGVSFVNDSKATNVDSVWYALQSVTPPVILIAGGKDKGGDFTRLRELVQKNVKALVLIGEAEDKIKTALGDLIPTFHADTLEEAVELSFKKAASHDTVLLSPGCASFDMFRDYQHRGSVFKASVRNLTPKRNANIFI